MNTWHNKKLQRKRVTAAFLIMMLLLSLTGCTDTSRYKLGRGLYWLNNRQKAAVYYDPNGIDLNSAGDPIEYASEENAEFEAYLDECFKDVVTSDSLAYHNNVYDGSVYGITPPEATLGDSSYAEADVEKEKEEYEESCKRLLSFENKPLTKEERFIYECMVKEAEVGKHLFDNIYLLEPFSPMRGIQADMPSSFINFRLENKSDIELYIELLNQWKDYFDVALEFEYVKSDAGYFMSDKVADVVIEQCDEFIQEKENHFLIQTFDETIDGFDFLTEEEKQSYKEQNRDAIFNSAIPAFEDVKKTISELKGTGKNENGICYFKGGKEHYESYCFPKYTGSSKSVGEEITIMDNREIDEVMDIQIMAELSRDAVMYYSDNYSNCKCRNNHKSGI